MGYLWTDMLTEPLASFGRNWDWLRVEETRDGRWLALSSDGAGDASWYDVEADGLRPLDPLSDDGLPALRKAVRRWLRLGYRMQLLAWRVHRRAVFRVFTPQGSSVCKIYHKERGQLNRWAALAEKSSASWRVPQLLEWTPQHRMLMIEDCPGRCLNGRWLNGGGSPADGDHVADVLEWLQSTPVPSDFPYHGVKHETRLLEDRLESFKRTLREPVPRAERAAHCVLEALAQESDLDPILCHRDLHDKQILLDEDRGGTLLDLDLAAAGPPALDVGNILAHLRLRALQNPRLPWRAIAERIARRAIPARRIEDSVHRWTAATLLRLTLIYSRRRRRETLLDDLLDSTEQALARDGQWRGIL
jgi:aminoglycoside phosphotransferase (APT) family kinase protein